MATATRLPSGDVIKDGNRKAAADLSTAQYTFVKIDTNGDIAAAGAGDRPYGVLQNQPKANESCSVVTRGQSLLKVDGSTVAIDEGDSLKPDASARGVKTTTATDIIGAQALEASAAANDLITVNVVEAKPYG